MRTLTFRKSRRGSAMVEFALISPLLLMLLGGVMDFSRVSYHGMGLHNAARAGVQYAISKPNQMYDFAGMQAAAIKAQPGLKGITATATLVCKEPPGDATEDPEGPTVSCATSGYVRQYIRVETTQNYSLMSNYLFLPKDLNLRGRAVMRIQ